MNARIPVRLTVEPSLIATVSGMVVSISALGLWVWMNWYSRQVTPGNGTSIWMPDYAAVSLPLIVWPLAAVAATTIARRDRSDFRRSPTRWPEFVLIGLASGFYLLPPFWSLLTWTRLFDTWTFAAGLVVAHAGMFYALLTLLSLARLPRSAAWLRVISIMLAWLIVVGFCALHCADDQIRPRTALVALHTWLGNMTLVAAVGAIAVGMFHRFALHRAYRSLNGEFQHYVMRSPCPRCVGRMEIAPGRNRCRDCGLLFYLDVEEELCVRCGYSLFGIRSACCPECGTARLADSVHVPVGGASEGLKGAVP